jgi:hypothetical protein
VQGGDAPFCTDSVKIPTWQNRVPLDANITLANDRVAFTTVCETR